MQDFNDYVKEHGDNENNGINKNLYDLVASLSSRFDGKSQSELVRAIYEEAKKGKRNGTLSNSDIDNFVAMLSPLLDDKKRRMLNKIANELKQI